ncbi:MAG: CSLREA domain-containing protein [Solirubrobacterales bacterium]
MLIAALLAATPAPAATIKVTTTDDELIADGDCSLREAVQSANNSVSFDACEKGQNDALDKIELRSREYALTLASTNENLNVNGDLDYTGGGPIAIRGKGIAATEIDANAIGDRVLQATGNARALTLESLDLENGTAPVPGSGQAQGGNLWAEAGSLALMRVSVEGGDAELGGGVRFSASRSVTVKRSRFENNDATDGGGLSTAVFGKPTTIRHTVFSLNTAEGDHAEGGALDATGDRVMVADSLFSENTAHADVVSGGVALGGAIFISGDSFGARIERSTFQKNVATRNGSSAAFGGAISAVRLDVVNTTFWDNESEEAGGALYGDASVAHSTFLANDAPEGGDHVYAPGGIGAKPIVLRNSILPGAQVAVDVCDGPGPVVSKGFNVFSYDDPDCATLNSDLVSGGNAGLSGSPFDNGGPTPTISIASSSVAKDLVPIKKCNAADGVDQRGYKRPKGPRCDAGAFERGAKS